MNWKNPTKFKEYNENPGPQHGYQKIQVSEKK